MILRNIIKLLLIIIPFVIYYYYNKTTCKKKIKISASTDLTISINKIKRTKSYKNIEEICEKFKKYHFTKKDKERIFYKKKDKLTNKFINDLNEKYDIKVPDNIINNSVLTKVDKYFTSNLLKKYNVDPTDKNCKKLKEKLLNIASLNKEIITRVKNKKNKKKCESCCHNNNKIASEIKNFIGESNFNQIITNSSEKNIMKILATKYTLQISVLVRLNTFTKQLNNKYSKILHIGYLRNLFNENDKIVDIATEILFKKKSGNVKTDINNAINQSNKYFKTGYNYSYDVDNGIAILNNFIDDLEIDIGRNFPELEEIKQDRNVIIFSGSGTNQPMFLGMLYQLYNRKIFADAINNRDENSDLDPIKSILLNYNLWDIYIIPLIKMQIANFMELLGEE